VMDGRSLKECILLAQAQDIGHVVTVAADGTVRRRKALD